MHLLDSPIRAYAWGSATEIPRLRGVPPTGEPQAELWMGAHPASPSSVVIDGERRSLLELIAADPEGELGAEVFAAYGARLPFLLKLLAAAEPLSLQAHPNPARARQGYDRENAAGIPLDAAHRNYKDPYAKPEMICALTPLEALAGFRSLDEVAADVKALGLGAELEPFLASDLRSAFVTLLELPESDRLALVTAVADACAGVELPVADLLRRLAARYPSDSGVVAALLLNHIVLEPGQSVLLPTGNLHAYIRGFGVELLANSDNVLRGGLTPKHVDVPELSSILDFTPGPAEVVEARGGDGEAVFASPAPEFRLSRIELTGTSLELDRRGGQILLCTAGQFEATSASGTAALTPGGSVYAAAREGAVTLLGHGTVFRATVNGVESRQKGRR